EENQSGTTETIAEANRGKEVMAALLTVLVNGFILSAAPTAVVAIVIRLIGDRLWNAATRYAIWWALLVFSVAVMPPLPRFRDNRTDERGPVKTPLNEASVSSPLPKLAAVQQVPPSTERWPRLPLRVSLDSWITWIAVAWFVVAGAMLSRLLMSVVILERRK